MRWAALYPLQRQLTPWFDFTLGETLVTVGVLAACVVSVVGGQDIEGSGSFAGNLGGLTLATACHSSIFNFLLGLPFERALRYHIFFAYLTVAAGFWHGYCAWNLPYTEDGVSKPAQSFDFGDTFYLAGVLFVGFMALMILFAQSPFRRRLFEFFYRLHIVLLLCTGASAALHSAGGMGFGAALWAFDVVLRYIYQANMRYTKTATLASLPGNVVRMSFDKKNFNYKAGQYLFVCIPEVSMFQWHPFSISSSPDQDEVSVHIRVLGDWTKDVYDLAHKSPVPKQYKVRLTLLSW
jgi:hypothetical protein